MIFLTMGTTDMKFDRLVKAIDNAVGLGLISDDVYAQIGCSGYIPNNMKYECFLEKKVFDRVFKESSFIIGHAGMGTISMALENKKPALLIPRLARFNEHVNDHQLYTAKKFEELGHVVCLYDPENNDELVEKIRIANNFTPKERRVQPDAVAKDIIDYLKLV